MSDTPQHIKDLQLNIWLSKSPAERLKQFLLDNEDLYKFWRTVKKNLSEKINRPDENDQQRFL